MNEATEIEPKRRTRRLVLAALVVVVAVGAVVGVVAWRSRDRVTLGVADQRHATAMWGTLDGNDRTLYCTRVSTASGRHDEIAVIEAALAQAVNSDIASQVTGDVDPGGLTAGNTSPSAITARASAIVDYLDQQHC